MRGNKIILAAWSALVVFCAIQVIWGPLGVLQTNDLQVYEQKLDKRLGKLQDENESLWRQYNSLRTSEGAVRLQARQLGWFEKNDIPVRVLSGPAMGGVQNEEVWKAYRPHVSVDNLSLFFRSAWFLLFFFFYLVFYFIDKLPLMSKVVTLKTAHTSEPKPKRKEEPQEVAMVPLPAVKKEPIFEEIPTLPTIRIWEKQAPEPLWRTEFPQIRSEH